MLFYTSGKRGIYTVRTVHTCHPGQNSTLWVIMGLFIKKKSGLGEFLEFKNTYI